MGQSLSTRFEWSQPTPSSSNGTSDGVLQTSVVNQQLLSELVRMIEQLCRSHPTEAKTEFRRPLQWASNLLPAHFPTGDRWTINTANKGSKVVVASSENKADGQPFFQLEQSGGPSSEQVVYVAKVASFEHLHRILQISDDNKLRELQDIVQVNPDPVKSIFGASGDTALVDAFEAFNNEQDNRKREQFSRLYKLLLILNTFDLQLMKSAVKDLQKEKSITIQKVTEELQMLQSFAGRDRSKPLVGIDWESEYTFANGYKAPPWRQVYGELSYIEVQPFDKEKLILTASKKGYFVNKGYSADDKGHEHLNYEALDDRIYSSITELLRANSPHFATNIDKQEYHYEPEVAPAAGESGGNSQHREDEAEEEDDYPEESNHQRRAENHNNKRTHVIKKNRAKAHSRTRAVEPSLKWRNLGAGNDGNEETADGRAHHRRMEKMKGAPVSGAREGRRGQRGRSVPEDEDFTDSDADDSEEEMQEKRQEISELPAEYYQIQKLVKYLRAGNQTATIIAICSLRDFDLTNEFNQTAIRDVGGLETLVNLLDTDDPKCKIGALKILRDISRNVAIRTAIADLDGMQPLVELLRDSDKELKCLAAETIAHCAKNARNRRLVRRYGGIRKLVRLLKARPGSEDEQVAMAGALALATCSKSARNKEAIQAAGSIPLLANLLESRNEQLLIPVVGILQECASDENYRSAIRGSGMVKFLVENLASKNQELQAHCASAIFKCAEEDETRMLVRQYNGLTHLVNLLDNTGNKELLVAATGAVWKCAQNLENVAAFNKLNIIKKLVGLMENQPEDVLVNVVGALGACAQTADGRQAIRESNGITPLVNLLTGTNHSLLVNVTTAVGACALDTDSMAIIDRLDGVRLLWSLLKSNNPQVQASAAWAISPCIEHAKDAGEMVRSFVGGLELIVSLLKSDTTEVLASVCAAIANIAKDEENLAVITDHGVVPMLGKLTNTRNDKLRRHLAEAIARCCHWGNNRVSFGTAGAVAPLVKYLRSPDDEVHRSTARALHQLSMDPDNCITMHEHGVVQLLLGMVGSADTELQEAAAGTIGNIRRCGPVESSERDSFTNGNRGTDWH
ncbi:armadillo-type protein [Phlyctochytrium arcticum]|nr:armadillo-type protein [Phlyctochytrium arcticum]